MSKLFQNLELAAFKKGITPDQKNHVNGFVNKPARLVK